MKTKNADLNKLQEETFVAIVTGSKSIDEFDDFVQSWKSRGGDQITKEVEVADNRIKKLCIVIQIIVKGKKKCRKKHR